MTPNKGHHKKNVLNFNNFSATSLIFDLMVSLVRVHQDQDQSLSFGYPLKGLKPAEPKNQKFEIYNKNKIFKWNSIFATLCIEYLYFLENLVCKKKLLIIWRKA